MTRSLMYPKVFPNTVSNAAVLTDILSGGRVNFHVTVYLRFGNKPFPAHPTTEGLFTCVSSHVIIQPLPSSKRLITRIALVRRIVRMRPSVYVHTISRFKRLPTNMAYVGSFSCVCGYVVIPCILSCERLSTEITTELFDFFVHLSYMARYVLFFNEAFTTNVTCLRSIAQVVFHVP